MSDVHENATCIFTGITHVSEQTISRSCKKFKKVKYNHHTVNQVTYMYSNSKANENRFKNTTKMIKQKSSYMYTMKSDI